MFKSYSYNDFHRKLLLKTQIVSKTKQLAGFPQKIFANFKHNDWEYYLIFKYFNQLHILKT